LADLALYAVAAGMCLVDTSDGALMMALYTSKVFARDTVAILYYSIVLTGITIFVAAFIGIIQLLTLVDNVAEPEGPFWEGVSAIGDNFDIIGASICGVFVIVGIASVLIYKPWRRRMEGRTAAARTAAIEEGTAAVADTAALERSDIVASASTEAGESGAAHERIVVMQKQSDPLS